MQLASMSALSACLLLRLGLRIIFTITLRCGYEGVALLLHHMPSLSMAQMVLLERLSATLSEAAHEGGAYAN